MKPAVADVDGEERSATAPLYTVSVRDLCAFAAKAGDLDLRFTPSPTAQQGREGHQLVAQRRGPHYESEVSLSTVWRGLRVRGRADGFDADSHTLEEVKTFRGRLDAMPENHRALHWAQLKVYGWMLCQARALQGLRLALVYVDVADHGEHPLDAHYTAQALREFFESLCRRFLTWALQESAHRCARDAALGTLVFPQLPFRAGQRDLAEGVYRCCVQGRSLLAQAPTGIGKTLGTLFPALRAMPVRGTDKLFFLTAKTPGRQVALEALHALRGMPVRPLRVVELVARGKACEHKDKACHGQSCPLAKGFYDRLPAAREVAAAEGWLDQAALRRVALAHAVCPYFLGQEMLRWSDVVVGDYNYYFDRTAVLHALALDAPLRVTVLADEAHNLYSRACSMYSTDLSHAEAVDVRPHVPLSLRGRVDEILSQWQMLPMAPATALPAATDTTPAWRVLDELPAGLLRAVFKFNAAVSEHLEALSTQAPGPVLEFYFRCLSFANLAESFGDHSLCELDANDAVQTGDGSDAGRLTLRNIVPAHFIAERLRTADALVLFSATLNPPRYYHDLLGLPQDALAIDIPSPFQAAQLEVQIRPISTRRDQRAASLATLVDTLQAQYRRQPGNYLAFFSSFDYLSMALQALREQHRDIPVWAQQRQMDEGARQDFLQRFDATGQGIGFAVLGGVFGEGVDLPGKRLIGAFVATLGLPQFDAPNQAICARLEARFGKGHDYTYVYPGLQKVVQAAGRVIRTEHDTGTLVLLDARYQQPRYRALLPAWWALPGRTPGGA